MTDEEFDFCTRVVARSLTPKKTGKGSYHAGPGTVLSAAPTGDERTPESLRAYFEDILGVPGETVDLILARLDSDTEIAKWSGAPGRH
jgi:hypothetical protein